jgi:hypothetical protein
MYAGGCYWRHSDPADNMADVALCAPGLNVGDSSRTPHTASSIVSDRRRPASPYLQQPLKSLKILLVVDRPEPEYTERARRDVTAMVPPLPSPIIEARKRQNFSTRGRNASNSSQMNNVIRGNGCGRTASAVDLNSHEEKRTIERRGNLRRRGSTGLPHNAIFTCMIKALRR